MVRTSDQNNGPKRDSNFTRRIGMSTIASICQHGIDFFGLSSSFCLFLLNARHFIQAAERLSFNCVVGQHGANKWHNKFACHGVSWETSYISLPTIHGIFFWQLASLDVSFIHSSVMVNVNGQKSPSWDESLLSADHVNLTQLCCSQKHIASRGRVQEHSTGVRLVLASD